ncbi:unnamed protein product [Prorocentrum cordatum]|uniref:Sugar phosphate transporter domain-containing protein n=1 Tax=Prorocentrum cordatum TaxID=2364126 RepID=A0ABN9XQ09_9DINO|nr:unnamed protein product [Polarella glacialis]
MGERWLEIGFFVAAWYLTSFSTLLLNKHLLGALHIRPNTLAVVQMVSTAIYGAVKTVDFGKCARDAVEVARRGGLAADKGGDVEEAHCEGGAKAGHGRSRLRRSLAEMGLVGAMRFATVVLGLVSLNHVAASFTETIKASAPFFTVIIAYLMLGEATTPKIVLSLVPVAGGLVLVSYSELSFNVIGFGAAVATNVIECVQNVFSKRLLTKDYTATQLQFYTSLTALVLQGPIFLLLREGGPGAALPSSTTMSLGGIGLADIDVNETHESLTPASEGELSSSGLGNGTLFLLWIDGVLYHAQSVVAYVVMSYLSPVTVSVVNTLKRALLIWISVLVFGNEVTAMGVVGTLICLSGALCYNVARQSPAPKNK